MLVCYDEQGGESYNAITASAFEYLLLKGDAAAELIFASPEQIRAVNLRTRGMDKPTDVLSFPMLENPIGKKNYQNNEAKDRVFNKENYPRDFDPELSAVFLGSIMICREIAADQAAEQEHSAEYEESFLFLHGLLHLLGFDHETESDYLDMMARTSDILNLAQEKSSNV